MTVPKKLGAHAGFLLIAASSAFACTIPVFRFALDRWNADSYHLVVPASSSKNVELARALLPYRGNGPANVHIEESNGPVATEAQLFLPNDAAHTMPLWHGLPTPQSFHDILESPARKELLQRLLAGESVVWVIVDGGAETERLEKRLSFLERVIEIPPQDTNDPDSQLGPGPTLRLKLSSMHLSVHSNEEKLFCAMLAGTKAAAALAKGEPFAAAVFGRGRVIGAWPLSQLDDTALEDISMFLTGRCSCRVKNESPGWDVLLNVDWESALQKVQEAQKNAPQTETKTPDLSVASLKPETVVVTAQTQETARAWPNHAAPISVGVLAIVAGVGWLLLRRLGR